MTSPVTPQAAVVVDSGIDDHVQIRDFTLKNKYIKFRIDDDVFTANAVLSIPLMQELVSVAGNVSKLMNDQKYDVIFDLFDKLLIAESATRFRARGTATDETGIDAKRQLIPILMFLLEEYGVRPTQPSSDSSTGSPSETGGTTSTDGQSAKALEAPAGSVD